MMRKLLLSALLLIVLGGIGLFFWARAVFTQDAVRVALAAELSERLGQPVTIGSISATLYPRVTVRLDNVVIGEPAGVHIDVLNLGADFRALLSRKIEHASARVEGAKIQLPLIPLGRAPAATPPGDSAEATGAPVQLVSIDEIVLDDVDLIRAERTLHGHIDLAPESGRAWTVRRLSLIAEGASIEATGRITDWNGPTGELTMKAAELDVDRLLAFVNDFAGEGDSPSGHTVPQASGITKPDLNITIEAMRAKVAGLTLDQLSGGAHVTGTGMDLTLKATRAKLADFTLENLSGRALVSDKDLHATIDATRGQLANLTVDGVSGQAHITDTGVLLKPVAFGVFGGKYNGAIGFRPAASEAAPSVTVNGALAGIEVVTMTRLAGAQTDPITGRLSAQVDLTGSGVSTGAALRSMHGIARVTIVNGVVRNLGLLRAIVVGTSMRGSLATLEGASAAASAEAAKSRDESFKTLTATLAVAGGRGTTRDLRMEGTDVSLTARGSFTLNGSDLTFTGQAQLSQELTAKAGRDLIRYTRENGRVTLPVTITGPAAAPSVQIDVGAAMNRAIRNRVEEELQKTIMKGLGDLFKKPPK